jgi:hypothetical protein
LFLGDDVFVINFLRGRDLVLHLELLTILSVL